MVVGGRLAPQTGGSWEVGPQTCGRVEVETLATPSCLHVSKLLQQNAAVCGYAR